MSITTTRYALTAEQQAVIDLASSAPTSPLIINARAGSGKTATLIELLSHLSGKISLQAFNRSIADELKAKTTSLPLDLRLRLNISTVHGFGLAALRAANRKPQVMGGKLSFVLKDLMRGDPRLASDDDLWQNTSLIRKLAGFFKQSGFGILPTSKEDLFPAFGDKLSAQMLADHHDLFQDRAGDTPEEEIIEWAFKLLEASNARQSAVDFDDMIYFPLLFSLPIPPHAHVLIDEAQDINAVRRELAFRAAGPSGRVIAVGDPNQAIYGFTGAATDSLDRIAHRAKAPTLPLSICWRCDEAIIAEAQRLVPDIKPRPGAPAGLVETMPYLGRGKATLSPQQEKRLGDLAFRVVADTAMSVAETDEYLQLKGIRDGEPGLIARLQPGDVILCRLNKPNLAVALALIHEGKPCKIEGRDIGENLLRHVKAANPAYQHVPVAELIHDLDSYLDKELAMLLSKNKSEAVMALFTDEVAAANLLLDRALSLRSNATFDDVETIVKQLFGDDLLARDIILLSSIHKSKGREWPRVYILGKPDYLPFHLAKLPWEKEAERNLEYVAITRAQHHLIMVSGVQAALEPKK